MGREDEIKIIAYGIWQEDGCCDGKHIEHWLKAEIMWQEQQKPAPVKSKTETEKAQTGIKNNQKPANKTRAGKKS